MRTGTYNANDRADLLRVPPDRPRNRCAAKKRNELPPELRGRATIVRDVNRIFRRAARSLARFVELGGPLS